MTNESSRRRRKRTPAEETRWRKRHGSDLYSGWPPSKEQQDAATAAAALSHVEYTATKNPLFVWEAIADCASVGVELPPWVIEYLQSVALSLASHSRSDIPVAGKISHVLRSALGFDSGRGVGRKNPFRLISDRAHVIGIAFEVYQLRLDGLNDDNAIMLVAKSHHKTCDDGCRRPLSETKVRSAWNLYRDSFPQKLSRKSPVKSPLKTR